MERLGESRKHSRLAMRLTTVCNKLGLESGDCFFIGTTVNISTGGLLIKTSHDNVNVGDTVSLKMTVPPSSGLLEKGGRLTAHAKVKRIEKSDKPDLSHAEKTKDELTEIAMQFCDCPKLTD